MCVGFKLKFDNCKHISSNSEKMSIALDCNVAWIINLPSRFVLHSSKILIFLTIEQDVNLSIYIPNVEVCFDKYKTVTTSAMVVLI